MDNCKYCDRYHNCSLMDEDFDPWIDVSISTTHRYQPQAKVYSEYEILFVFNTKDRRYNYSALFDPYLKNHMQVAIRGCIEEWLDLEVITSVETTQIPWLTLREDGKSAILKIKFSVNPHIDEDSGNFVWKSISDYIRELLSYKHLMRDSDTE